MPSKSAAAALVVFAAFSSVSCIRNTDCVILDPAPAIARLRAGGSVEREVDELARPVVENGSVHGLVVAVLLPDGTEQTFCYGENAVSARTLFELGSVTKVFVAALLAVLVEEKALRYEDTIRDILPPGTPLGPGVGDITLFQLVTHTSGLPREPVCWGSLHAALHYLSSGTSIYSYLDRPFLYDYLRTCSVDPAAERTVCYSNVATGLLAHLIEVRTGRDLEELLSDKVTGPLGMTDTVFTPNEEQRKRVACGHVGENPCLFRHDTEMAAWDLGEILRGTGALYSTASDLLRFARANLALPPHALSPTLAAMHAPRYPGPLEDIALGWIVNNFEGGQVAIVHKYGIISGYSAYIGMDDAARVAVVVLSDTFLWHDTIGQNLVLRLGGAARAAPAVDEEVPR